MERDRFPVVVHVLLIEEEQLFLLRRARTGFLDGYYGLPGGHQHAGEGVLAAAARECTEETGIVEPELTPVCVLAYRSDSHQGLNFVFEATRWRGTPANAEPEHCDVAGWFALNTLPEPRVGWLAEALRMRGSGQWYRELDAT
jgi:8-oxo-dGTP diphosphatase